MKNTYYIKNRRITGLLLITAFILTLSSAFKNQSDQIQDVEEVAETNFVYRKIKNQAFHSGEKLNFRVHYGIINAATITMEVKSSNESFEKPNEIKGRRAYHIITEGKTLKAFDWAFKVRDRFESWVDQESLAPLKYTKQVQENKYIDHDLVYFRHISGKLNGKKGSIDMEAYTQDIVSALYYARNIDFSQAKKGDLFPINVYLDNKIYSLSFRFEGEEIIKSDIGKIKCYKLVPRLVVDRVFKGEEDMTVWISADKNKIPIRVKSDIQVGSLKVDITDFEGLRNPFDARLKS
jgi:hypothetical protein